MPRHQGQPTPPSGTSDLRQGDDYLRAWSTFFDEQGVVYGQGPVSQRPAAGEGARLWLRTHTDGRRFLDVDVDGQWVPVPLAAAETGQDASFDDITATSVAVDGAVDAGGAVSSNGSVLAVVKLAEVTNPSDTDIGSMTLATFNINDAWRGYRGLRIVYSIRTSDPSQNPALYVRLNNDQGTASYRSVGTRVVSSGDGTAATVDALGGAGAGGMRLGIVAGDGALDGAFGAGTIELPNAFATQQGQEELRHLRCESGSATFGAFERRESWSGTHRARAKLNAIQLIAAGTRMRAGSYAALYGVR